MSAMSPFRPAPRRLRQLAVSVPLSLALLGGGLPASAEDVTSPADSAQDARQGTDLPLDELRTFAEVFERIKRTYVDQVDDRTLLKNAMRGMLEGLDPHSAYLDQEDWQDLRENTDGEFGGIGIEVGTGDDGQLTVIAPIDDTPAARAGLQPRDVILKIDNTPLDGLSMSESVKLMRGEAGSRIRLLILSEGADMPREVVLERAIIKSSSVSQRLLLRNADGFQQGNDRCRLACWPYRRAIRSSVLAPMAGCRLRWIVRPSGRPLPRRCSVLANCNVRWPMR